MANTNNPNGFQWVRNLSGASAPAIDWITLGGTVAEGDALVFSAGACTIALSNSPLIHGVAAEPGVSGDSIMFYPAIPDAVFEAQTSGSYSAASHLHVALDISGATGVQEVNQAGTTEKVFMVIGLNSNSETGNYARVQGTFVRSSYTGLEDQEA